jgi:hypothetical protein
LLWHALSTVGPLYRQACAFLDHVQSIKFTTGGLPSCRNISMMINGNRMHQSSISSLIAKNLNTYLNKVFQLFFLMNLPKILKTCFHFIIMGYCM